MADERHVPNELSDAELPEDVDARLSVRLAETGAALLDRCAAFRHTKASVYVGAAGVALVCCKLAALPDRPFGDREDLLHKAGRLLEAAVDAPNIRRDDTSFLEGVAGPLAVAALHQALCGRGEAAGTLAERVLACARVAAADAPGECELLYGRCGFLFAVLFLRRHLGDPRLGADAAAALAGQVLAEGRRAGGRHGFPLYWKWHDKAYFGAAHGFAGILCVLLHLRELLGPEDLRDVRATLDRLLAHHTLPSGNICSSYTSDADRLVQWCHGAPGFVVPLILAEQVFGGGEYLRRAVACGEVIWARGLLQKGVGLCHGISGNGYAFLALYRATRDAVWLRRARQFARFLVDHLAELEPKPDRPYSLFEGAAGAVAFLADVLRPDTAAFPAWEL